MRSRIKFLLLGLVAAFIAAVVGYDLMEGDLSSQEAVPAPVAEESPGEIIGNPSSAQVVALGHWRLR